MQRIIELWTRVKNFHAEAETTISIIASFFLVGSIVLSASTSFLAYIQGASAPAFVFLFFALLAILLLVSWLIVLLVDRVKYQSQRELRKRYLATKPSDEKGFLDFLAEGEQAIADLTKTLQKVAKYTARVGRKISRRTRSLRWARSSVGQLKVATKAAEDIDKYSMLMENQVNTFAAISKILGISYTGILKQTKVTNEHQKKDLRVFIEAIQFAQSAVPETVEMLAGFRDSIRALNGIANKLNISSMRLVGILSRFLGALKKFDKTCDKLVALAKECLK